MVPRLPLSEAEARRVFEVVLTYTGDRSALVRTHAMQALHDLALAHPALTADALRRVGELAVIGGAAMRARGRRLLPALRAAAASDARRDAL